MSAPSSSKQSDVALQQSAPIVQRSPSGTHPLAHCIAEPGRHSLEQQSRATAQLAPVAAHAFALSHRSTLVESITHVTAGPPQHCGLALQTSPCAAHPPLALHRLIPSPSSVHDPEQQSVSLSQRSQSGVHPPIGVHRRAPSLVVRQLREQQSSFVMHASHATLLQPLPSPALQAIGCVQRPMWHRPEQQSLALPHTSPVTRQAWSSVQRSV